MITYASTLSMTTVSTFTFVSVVWTISRIIDDAILINALRVHLTTLVAVIGIAVNGPLPVWSNCHGHVQNESISFHFEAMLVSMLRCEIDRQPRPDRIII